MRKSSVLFSIVILLFIGACKNGSQTATFPKNSRLVLPKYSSLFQIAVTTNDTFLKLIDPTENSKSLGNYCWGKSAHSFSGFTKIQSKKRIVAMSAVFIGMIEALHGENAIVGVDNIAYISSPKTFNRAQKGQISSVSPNGNLQKETLVSTKPDLILGYYTDAKGQREMNQLQENHIPVIFLQNYLEKHPLGRAEWILVFGALLGKLEQAEGMFASIEEHYLLTKERAESAKSKPTVLINAPFSGTWDVPAGDSYMATLFNDAGGNYIFSNHKGAGRIPMGIEQVFAQASKADVWFNPGACRERACMLQLDQRIAQFSAFKNQNIFNCTKQLKANGANAWWDYGVLRPDMVLLDLFAILHPEIEFEHEPVFFEKVQP